MPRLQNSERGARARLRVVPEGAEGGGGAAGVGEEAEREEGGEGMVGVEAGKGVGFGVGVGVGVEVGVGMGVGVREVADGGRKREGSVTSATAHVKECGACGVCACWSWSRPWREGGGHFISGLRSNSRELAPCTCLQCPCVFFLLSVSSRAHRQPCNCFSTLRQQAFFLIPFCV